MFWNLSDRLWSISYFINCAGYSIYPLLQDFFCLCSVIITSPVLFFYSGFLKLLLISNSSHGLSLYRLSFYSYCLNEKKKSHSERVLFQSFYRIIFILMLSFLSSTRASFKFSLLLFYRNLCFVSWMHYLLSFWWCKYFHFLLLHELSVVGGGSELFFFFCFGTGPLRSEAFSNIWWYLAPLCHITVRYKNFRQDLLTE